MKIQVMGVKRVTGVSTKSGTPQPFDICTVMTLAKIEGVSSDKVSVTGFGFESSEVRLAPEAIPQFSTLKFPCVLDLETDMVPFRGRLEPLVVGIVKEKAVA